MSNTNYWQLVFNQSRANGAEYFGERLPSYSWEWPQNTFLQRRLRELRKQRGGEVADFVQGSRRPGSAAHRKRRIDRHEEMMWLQANNPGHNVEEH